MFMRIKCAIRFDSILINGTESWSIVEETAPNLNVVRRDEHKEAVLPHTESADFLPTKKQNRTINI